MVRIETAQGAVSTLEVTNAFTMVDGKATIFGGAGVSTLNLADAKSFTMSAGRMSGIDIVLGSATNHAITGKIDGTVRMDSTHLVNHGVFTLVSGSIAVGTGFVSAITNEVGGAFEVQSYAAGFGGDAGQNGGLFTNRGTLKFNSSLNWISADFLNEGGTVQVLQGETQFGYEAEQTSGTFELRGDEPTVKMTGSHPLGIRDGLITGVGTIDGNLVLGYDGGPATYVTIRPGIDGGYGTIDITHIFHIFSPNAPGPPHYEPVTA